MYVATLAPGDPTQVTPVDSVGALGLVTPDGRVITIVAFAAASGPVFVRVVSHVTAVAVPRFAAAGVAVVVNARFAP